VDRLEGRRLPGAARAEEDEHAPLRHRERHPVEGGRSRGVGLPDVVQLDRGRGHELQPSFRSFLKSPEISALSRRRTPLANVPRIRRDPVKPSPSTCTRIVRSPAGTSTVSLRVPLCSLYARIFFDTRPSRPSSSTSLSSTQTLRTPVFNGCWTVISS